MTHTVIRQALTLREHLMATARLSKRQRLIAELSRTIGRANRETDWQTAAFELLDRRDRHWGQDYDNLGYDENWKQRRRFFADLHKHLLKRDW